MNRRPAKSSRKSLWGQAEDVDEAVTAAAKAQPAWEAARRQGSAPAIIYALARMVQRHARLFAVLEALDNGKPIRETRDLDIPLVARHFYHHAGWAELQDSGIVRVQAASVSSVRSSRGTSRCSCWPGRSRRHSRSATRWF